MTSTITTTHRYSFCLLHFQSSLDIPLLLHKRVLQQRIFRPSDRQAIAPRYWVKEMSVAIARPLLRSRLLLGGIVVGAQIAIVFVVVIIGHLGDKMRAHVSDNCQRIVASSPSSLYLYSEFSQFLLVFFQLRFLVWKKNEQVFLFLLDGLGCCWELLDLRQMLRPFLLQFLYPCLAICDLLR